MSVILYILFRQPLALCISHHRQHMAAKHFFFLNVMHCHRRAIKFSFFSYLPADEKYNTYNVVTSPPKKFACKVQIYIIRLSLTQFVSVHLSEAIVPDGVLSEAGVPDASLSEAIL